MNHIIDYGSVGSDIWNNDKKLKYMSFDDIWYQLVLSNVSYLVPYHGCQKGWGG